MHTAAEKLKVEGLLKFFEGEDREKVRKAIDFIEERHEHQVRASGEPYIMHPIEVAITLAEMGLDADTIVAALLHDVLEDTPTTYQELKEKFGQGVADIVQGVTKLGKFEFKDMERQKAENYRKLLLATAKDLRVILVKLADRLHNMKTLGYLRKDKQVRIAKETLEIYVPIANRLGVWKIKTELEDLCFMYLYPAEYERVKNFVGRSKKDLEEYLKRSFIPKLKEALRTFNIDAHIMYRPKHLYGIWQKTVRKGIKLEDVHDVLGVRVILSTPQECYLVLGIIHSTFKPVPGKFDDYISLPKPNLYQSLHTAVIGPKGRMVEVQIRTWEMHERAEKGIAAHWAYKEGKTLKDNSIYAWLKSLVESIQGSKNPQELIENMKMELFSEEVFVFTPKGDLLVLPKGATPVDFAYHIHTDIGNQCAGAKVNGRIVSLNYKLQNGDMVEIITNPSRRPNPEWLKFVVTSKAKNKIKAYLRQLEKERYLQEGRQILDKITYKLELSKEAILEKLLQEIGFKSEEDLLVAVGSGKVSKEKIYSLFQQKIKEKHKEERKEDLLIIDGLGSVLHSVGTCCLPIPGEEVYGVITRGRGVVVHSKLCPNLQYIQRNLPEKVIPVVWRVSGGKHPVRIRVVVKDKVGVLAEITSSISKVGANILEAKTKSTSTGKAFMEFLVEVSNYAEFLRLLDTIRSVEGVEICERVFS
ncbi:(p)ppGpp synthetase I, SpoT/RelA [Hydrogenobacter thermophilus TK-6]|uniref:(P)ppGpp 3-pyrophosphohydrolase n=1 Tax=Hydrogenobacter thermophilus (strain DSM 6534 / IAM 12695 / TK-6) TaxID=608538 RepID=D3DFK3_HYDTT|nr:bifunctional (p)ppGpp synthetase/guanosine-3',5'-bis(diphosphate) 3'-pyrophosphohydrolase [Hydrogenobacter thermophilus]ADO44549.1 (p)ppGpp synthetase I, SpoT/RelA [Hydrogenobacter thermophilus TK-6]BAI68605.1 (p)ppGpp 3-pyrophosphohydrolase [Hydrogenobacter thermophilus TK-6]